MKPLRLDSEARSELLHEAQYFEAERPGRGRKFRENVKQVFSRIKAHPQHGKPDEAGTRRMRIKEDNADVWVL